MLGLDTSMLIGMFVSSILYGIFLLLFIASIYVLVQKRTTPRPNFILIGVEIVMFFFSTIIIAISFSRILDGFITFNDTLGPTLYFELGTMWKQLAHMIFILLYSLFADAILIWRCWVVYSRDWKIIAFNIVLWVGTAVTVFINIVLTSQITLGKVGSEAAVIVNRYNSAFLGLTLGQNLIMTSLIVFRLWRVNAAAAPFKQSSFMPVIIVMIESGALYATTVLAQLLTTLVVPVAEVAVTDILSTMIGITFSLVIVRTGLRARNEQSYRSTRPQIPTFQSAKSTVKKGNDWDVEVSTVSVQSFEERKDAVTSAV